MQNCYNTKKDQEDRLTTKHIKTLSFLQEIVEENKQLKAKIKEYEEYCSQCNDLHEVAKTAKDRIAQIQHQYLARADEINQMLLEKHKLELMKKVDERVEAEKQWQEERIKLLEEIDGYKRQYATQQEVLGACKEHGEQIKILELKVDALDQEIERYKEKVSDLEKENKSQQIEIQRLQYVDNKGSNLTEELMAQEQHNKELEFKVGRLEKMLETRSDGKEQEEQIASLRAKLTKLIGEKSAWELRETDYKKSVDDLQTEVANLKRALADSERMRSEMHQQLDQLLAELARLKDKLSSKDREKENFKEYVQMKRDLQILQEENEMLRAHVKKGAASKGARKSGQLPSLTATASTSYHRIDSGSGKVRPPPSYATIFNGKT